jgi:hypothetical protein
MIIRKELAGDMIMSNLISFSVWGSQEKYLKGCIQNIHLAKKIYPGWRVRFYYDSEVSKDFINELSSLGAETVCMFSNESKWEGLFWRFLPAGDPSIDTFISRDIDSRLNEREKAAVDEWLLSGKHLHCMRDHIEHNVPMLGGMWGCRGRVLENISNLMDGWMNKKYKGSDQDFLRIEVWDKLRYHAIVHDKYYAGLTIEQGQYKEGYISKYDADHPKDGEIIPDYVYDPQSFFGEHLIRPFPPHNKMIQGTHVGEIYEVF